MERGEMKRREDKNCTKEVLQGISKEAYWLGVNILQNEFESKKRILAKKYALSNSSIKKGDHFTDHASTIIVDKIQWTYSLRGLPECIYSGIELKKDGKPFKDNRRKNAYQSNKLKK